MIVEWIDFIMIALVLMNLALLSFKQLLNCIRIVAFQGVVVGLVPLLFFGGFFNTKIVFVTLATIVLKGIIFPLLFFHAFKKAKINKEIEPFVSFKFSVFIGLLALLVSFWISRNLIIPSSFFSLLVVPTSFFTIFVGLFIIISRLKAITQALGYLVMENGICMFGYAFLIDQPLLVELGILLDVFVAVFVMGITIFHISQQFDHINTRYLTQLKD